MEPYRPKGRPPCFGQEIQSKTRAAFRRSKSVFRGDKGKSELDFAFGGRAFPADLRCQICLTRMHRNFGFIAPKNVGCDCATQLHESHGMIQLMSVPMEEAFD